MSAAGWPKPSASSERCPPGNLYTISSRRTVQSAAASDPCRTGPSGVSAGFWRRMGRSRPGTPGLNALAKAGLLLPTPDGPAFPLEFAFTAPEYLPDESLLGLIARAGLADLGQWLDELRTIVGTSGRERFSSLLSYAAGVYRLLTDHAERLVTGLDEAARAALEELGPADGLVGRRSFLAKHAPGLADGPWLPYKIPASCPASLRQLLIRGLLAPSGSAWQPGVYLHIPTELRPAALRRHYQRMEERAESMLAAAAQSAYQPAGGRINVDGPALLRHAAGALAAAPLRLTQKGQIPQADLERLARVLVAPAAQAGSLGLAGLRPGVVAGRKTAF